jgi:hypothetical protein
VKVRNDGTVTIESWIEAAKTDAGQRGLPELKPLLDGLAQGTRTLRAADFNCYSVRPAAPAAPPKA